MKRRANSFDYVTSKEKENIRKTRSLMKKEIRLCEDSFNLLVQLLGELFPHPGKEPRSITDMAVLPISSKIVMSLKSYFNLTMMGYYHEAVILRRNVLESVLLCMLVAEKPKFAKRWIEGRIEPKEVRNELGLGRSVADIYGMMSDYVHLNKASIGTFVKRRIEKQENLMITNWFPKFDEESARSMLVPILGPLLISYFSRVYEKLLSARLLERLSAFMKRVEVAWKTILDADVVPSRVDDLMPKETPL